MGGGAFGIKVEDSKLFQISGDVTVAALIFVPSPYLVPILLLEMVLPHIGPCDVMASILRWQIDAVGLVISGNHHAANIECRIFA